jgi:transposase InsO family protein
MCSALRLSTSGYYAWQRRWESCRDWSSRQLLTRIKVIHGQSRQTYGSPRITATLRAEGLICNEKRVARLMREHGIKAKTRRKFRVTTNSRHRYPVALNVLNRQFTVTAANHVWVSDITYLWTNEGWLYLAGCLDLYSRQIVGWALSERIDSQLTLTALQQALGRRQPPSGLLHHSDQGVQYAATAYQQLLTKYAIIPSMSRKGDCYDNAVMESFFATLKRELITLETFATREEAKQKVFEYIEVFYNRQRRHSTLGYLTPVEFEQINRTVNTNRDDPGVS